MDGFAAFRERRRIEHDEVIRAVMRGLKRRKQVEHVRCREVHALIQAVELRVLARLRHGELGDVHSVHVRRAAMGGVEREASRVREAVEHVLSRGKLGHCTAVVLHGPEKPVFWPFSKSTS